ncbi:MAG: putative DNA modification/repair radical SAM protein [Ruthenibacterium sp.]
MDVMEKLTILTDSAKYDVACTSSGSARTGNSTGLGSTVSAGICHTFSADGRCVSLLKVLLSNFCVYNCQYCVNRVTSDVPRAAFTPRELAELTIGFYRRNYIEGLFLSSAVLRSPDYTMEQMIAVLELLRGEYHFRGYIHAKTIPGADSLLVARLGLLADRLSVNIELPSAQSLALLAPDKSKQSILAPMKQVSDGVLQNKAELTKYHSTPQFAPAGQSTQMIVGASPESDFQILRLTEGLYQKYSLKRVFFSAYIPVTQNILLPALDTKPPLLREHRLYQADWLLRFYAFKADEILDENNQNFNPYLDPKCNWAIHHMELFPVDINACSYEMLLRVPGIGVKSAQRIRTARRGGRLDWMDLKRIGVVLKRAQYFMICRGFSAGAHANRDTTVRALLDPKAFAIGEATGMEQLSLFAAPDLQRLASEGYAPQIAAQTVKEEAVACILRQM